MKKGQRMEATARRSPERILLDVLTELHDNGPQTSYSVGLFCGLSGLQTKRYISRLKEHRYVRLVDSERKSLDLTAEGEVLRRELKAVLDKVEPLVERVLR